MKKLAIGLLLVVFLGLSIYPSVQAANTVTFTTTIAQGTLLANIRDSVGNSISNPTVDLGSVVNEIDCRYGSEALRNTLGVDGERIYVDNPNAATNGWTLTLAPVSGSGALWDGDEGNKFDFNDSGVSGLGCTDNDGDAFGGELMIDSTTASFDTDCMSCSANHISLGFIGAESFANNPSITLMTATDQADSLGSWYLTGMDVVQSIPAAQEGDNYSIQFTLTATAS